MLELQSWWLLTLKSNQSTWLPHWCSVSHCVDPKHLAVVAITHSMSAVNTVGNMKIAFDNLSCNGQFGNSIHSMKDSRQIPWTHLLHSLRQCLVQHGDRKKAVQLQLQCICSRQMAFCSSFCSESPTFVRHLGSLTVICRPFPGIGSCDSGPLPRGICIPRRQLAHVFACTFLHLQTLPSQTHGAARSRQGTT